MPTCPVKLPFGDEIVGDFSIDYEIDSDLDQVSPDFGIDCDGFWVGRVTDADRRYTAFRARAGAEEMLAKHFAEAARDKWSGRILDACQRHAEDNKHVNMFMRR